MIHIEVLPKQDFNCLKQPKNEVKTEDNLFQRMLQNEIRKLQESK